MSDHEYAHVGDGHYKGPRLQALPETIRSMVEGILSLLSTKQGILLEVSIREAAFPEQLSNSRELFQTDMGFFSAYYLHDGCFLYSLMLKTPGGSMAVDRDIGKYLGFDPKKMVIVERPSPGILLFVPEQ